MYYRLSHDVVTLRCKSRRFDCLLLVFIRRWGRLVSTPTRPAINYPLWNEVKFIDRDSHWYTRRAKEAIHKRVHPNNINWDSRIEIPEAWMPTIKKRPENGTTADHWGSKFSPEQWGSKCTNHNRPWWYQWCHVTIRPHRLMKTSSKQSKRRDLHLKVTTIIHLLLLYLPRWTTATTFSTYRGRCSWSYVFLISIPYLSTTSDSETIWLKW